MKRAKMRKPKADSVSYVAVFHSQITLDELMVPRAADRHPGNLIEGELVAIPEIRFVESARCSV